MQQKAYSLMEIEREEVPENCSDEQERMTVLVKIAAAVATNNTNNINRYIGMARDLGASHGEMAVTAKTRQSNSEKGWRICRRGDQHGIEGIKAKGEMSWKTQKITTFFLYCTIINGTILALAIIGSILGPDLGYRLQSQWFQIPRDTLHVIIYSFLGIFKIFWLVFNVAPYMALLIMRKCATKERG